jgi:hypothetical protein
MNSLEVFLGQCAALAARFDDAEWMPPDDVIGTALFPALVHPPMRVVRKTLFFPKVSGALRYGWIPALPADVRTVVRYALPTPNSVDLLRAAGIVGADHALHFVGDLDPLDLTIFVALRSLAPEARVELCGMNDFWLAQCEATCAWQSGLPTIAMDPFEMQHLALLDAFAPLEGLVGPASARLLRSGHKLELEGALNPAFYRAEHRDWALATLLA